MPKQSKRAKQVHLSKVKKSPAVQKKDDLIKKVRKGSEKFKHIFLLDVENFKTAQIQKVRKFFADSLFFHGKHRVLQLALGVTPESEIKDNMHQLAQAIKGTGMMLMFTNKSVGEVQKGLAKFSQEDFAKTGFEAPETITIQTGDPRFANFAASQDAHLRSLGLPTSLKNGVIQLLGDFVACKEGKPLTVDQAQILKLLNVQLATFAVYITAGWSEKDGFVEF